MTIPILPRRILVSIPRNIIDDAIQRGDVAICFRVGGTDCCYTGSPAKYSNTVCYPLPSLPEPEDPPCVAFDNISGFTIKISYDPENCARGHTCNRALFNCYVNDVNVGQVNLNNLGIGPSGEPTGGPRSSSIILPPGTVALDDRYEVRLEKDASLTTAHRGISRIQIFDLENRIIFDQCARDDVANFIFVC